MGRVSLEAVKDFRGDLIVDAGKEISEEIAERDRRVGCPQGQDPVGPHLRCAARCLRQVLWAQPRYREAGGPRRSGSASSRRSPSGSRETQLTMRTFHIGGTASVFENSALEARHEGMIWFSENLQTVTDRHGNLVVINRSGSVEVRDREGRAMESHPVVYGARIKVASGSPVSAGEVIVEWDPYSFSILSEEGGTVAFQDIIGDVTMVQEVDNVTFESQDDRFEPRIEIRDSGERVLRTYLMPSRAHLEVEEGDLVHPGDVLAKIPRETTKTKDITGGLPRVVELFEARPPKSPALISEIDGRLQYGEVRKGKRVISVSSQFTEDVREYEVPRGVHISVRENEEVRAGDPLMDGPRNPHDILRVLGEGELQRYLVHEIQEVYRLQGVVIDDKHIEVIISRMMRWVRVTDVGDTDLIVDSTVDRHEFAQANRKAQEEGGQSAQGEPMLLGLTKASLATDSFISAASFQETTKVLTEASLQGKVDYLRGLKENVIMGRLIPAGTGLGEHRRFVLPEEIDAQRQIMLRDRPEADGGYLEDVR